MLEEYFSIEIDEDGKLQALPLVLPGFTPNLDYLPSFLLCMGFKVRYFPVG
jgi:DNA mismatch repair protein MLH1